MGESSRTGTVMPPVNLPAVEITRPAKFAFEEFRFRGVLSRRVIANLVDWAIVLVALGAVAFLLFLTHLVTFGLLSVPMALVGLVLPFVYFIGYVGGPSSATPGMKLMDVEVRDISGVRPDLLQAGLRMFLYSASLATLTPLVLLVVFFNRRSRALHDILSASVVVRRASEGATPDR